MKGRGTGKLDDFCKKLDTVEPAKKNGEPLTGGKRGKVKKAD